MAKKKQRTTLFPFILFFIATTLIFSTVTPQGILSLEPLTSTLSDEIPQTIISVDIETQDINPNSDFSATIIVQPGQDIAGVQCDLHYNPSLITVIDVTLGNLFTGYDTYFTPGADPVNGIITGIAGVITTPNGYVNQTGIFATLHLKTLSTPGQSVLNLSHVLIGGPTANPVPVTVNNNSITVTHGAETTLVSINPQAQTIPLAETHTFTIMVSPATEISGAQATLDFDPSYIQILTITQGTLFGSTQYFGTTKIDNLNGTIDNIYSVTTGSGGTTIPGTLAHITFTSLQEGNTAITLKNVIIGDSGGTAVPHILQNGALTIGAASSTQIRITPPYQSIVQGNTGTVDIYIHPQEYVAGVQFDLTYNPSLLTIQDIKQGDFFMDVDSYFLNGTIDTTQGIIHGVAGAVLEANNGIINPGIFATVTFTTKFSAGESSIGLKNIILGNADAQPLSVIVTNGSIEILPDYTIISIHPEAKYVSPGETFTLDIWVNPLEAISGVETDITFNPSLLTAVSVKEGDLFNKTHTTHFNEGTIDNTNGNIMGIWGVIADMGGGDTTTPGSFAEITFTAGMAYGSTPINISHALIGTPEAQPVQINIQHGTVTIGFSLTFSLKTGWNTLSLPFQEMVTAESLGKIIGVSDAIAKWNPASEEYIIHPVGLTGHDFSIEPGHGYLIHVYEDTQFSIAGAVIDTLTIPIKMGWTLVGWIHDTSTTAEQFGSTITGCDAVAKWNPETQDYTIHPQTTPLDNFTIRQGDALFIHTTQDSIWYGG